MICIRCACTQDRACPGGCYWIATDDCGLGICSSCVERPLDELLLNELPIGALAKLLASFRPFVL